MVKKLGSTGNQLGLKSSYGMDMCLLLFKQTIAQYSHHGSPLFVAFLDASKGFDKVNNSKLFEIYLNPNANNCFCSSFARWYQVSGRANF